MKKLTLALAFILTVTSTSVFAAAATWRGTVKTVKIQTSDRVYITLDRGSATDVTRPLYSGQPETLKAMIAVALTAKASGSNVVCKGNSTNTFIAEISIQ